MKYCVDCSFMGTVANDKGLFDCSNKNSGFKVVSARKPKCDNFMECFLRNRGEYEKEQYWEISKKHGYFIMTAMSEILGLQENNKYIYYFMMLMDKYILENEDIYKNFIDDYNDVGPEISEAMVVDPDRKTVCEIVKSKLDDFCELVSEGHCPEAICKYNDMFDFLKKYYRIDRVILTR